MSTEVYDLGERRGWFARRDDRAAVQRHQGLRGQHVAGSGYAVTGYQAEAG